MKTLIVFLSLILTGQLSFAKERYDFSNISAAFQTFINEDLGQISGDNYDGLGDYWHLTSFAAQSVISDPANAFQTVHVCNYDYEGNEIQVQYEPFILDNFGNSKQFFVRGFYFITHTNPETQVQTNLIVRPSRDFLTVYVKSDKQDHSIRFVNLLRAFEVAKNPYRASALDLKTYPDWPPRTVFVFMKNVSEISSTWPDLILESSLKEVSFDHTEGFLSRLNFYGGLGINMKKGILLAGPPGTGKSFLGEILINSILKGDLKGKATMAVVSARHLEDSSSIRLLYRGMRALSPSVIFMEDIDLLGIKNRKDGKPGDFATETRLNELLNGMDGLIDSNHILTVGTTNRIDYVDEALTRSMRLGQHIWYGLPSFEERREFFNRFGTKMAIWDANVNDIWLASLTEGMSGSDIIEIIRLAKRDAFLANSWNGEKLFLTRGYFLSAVALLKEEHDAEKRGLVRASPKSTKRRLADAIRRLERWEQRALRSRRAQTR